MSGKFLQNRLFATHPQASSREVGMEKSSSNRRHKGFTPHTYCWHCQSSDIDSKPLHKNVTPSYMIPLPTPPERGQESASHSLFLLRQQAESTSWARKAEGRHVTNSLQHWCGNSGTLHAKTDWTKDLKATKGPGERQLWLGSVLWLRYWSYSTL